MFADLYLELDRTARAGAAADEAVAIFERLHTDAPDDPGYTVGLARACEQQGNVAVQRGRVPAAVDTYRRAVALFGRVPDDPDARHGLAVVRLRYGYMLWLQNDMEGARREIEAGDTLARELVAQAPADPDRRRTAALAREKVGDLLYYLPGRLADAGAAYTEAVAAFRALADAEPANVEREVDFNRAASSLAEYHLEKGELTQARALLTDALARANRLHDADPSNGRRHNLALRARALLLVVRAKEDPKADLSAEQRVLLEEDIAVLARLAARDPENANWRNRLAGQRLQLALSHLKAAEAGTDPKANKASADRVWDLLKQVIPAQRELIDQDPTNSGSTVILMHGYQSLVALARTGLRSAAETRPLLEDARRWLRDARGRVRFASDPGPVLEAIEKALADTDPAGPGKGPARSG
jgi:tetratricopeptide (TPR) repeat protein